MSWFDKITSAISPRWSYNREVWRLAASELRNYDAGKQDRLNDGWRPVFNESAQTTDRTYRDIIRARARDLERNSDIAGGLISALERNIVGKGITLQARTDDADFNKDAERLFREWSKARNCDVTGQRSFQQFLRLIVRRKYVDGGILIAKRYTSEGTVPLQLQLLEVDELDVGRISPRYKGNILVDGIETDAYGKVRGYWIRAYTPDGAQRLDGIWLDAEHVIFYKHSTRPGAVRELSPMAATISRIRDINSFMEAVAVKERVAACFSLFVKRVGAGVGSLGRSGETQAGGRRDYKGVSLSPGMILEGAPGDEATPISPAGNGGNAADFVRLQQRLAAAGQGLSYETAARDMSQVNYSSARQGLIEDWGTYDIEQQALVEHVLREVYETFIISAVLAGKLDAPGFWNRKRDYLRHVWVMPARRWIDPVKEANANKTALLTHQKTLADIYAEQGQDWEEKLEEAARIRTIMKQLGLLEEIRNSETMN